MSDIASRPFARDDFAACLSIFDSNVPPFFDPSERPEFCAFLHGITADRTPYLVLLRNGIVVGCGGLIIDADARQATLCWGMIHRACHGAGLGTALTRERLGLAAALPQVDEVVLATSQHTQQFYAGFGFGLRSVAPNGFGAGLDRWDMALRLRPARR